jgi:anti-sigma-K factor RskA
VTTDDKNTAGSGSYVLDAMDAQERTQFEMQLAQSEDLRNEVTELTDTAVLLGMAIAPVTPPDALKRDIMAKLSQTPQLPREAAIEDDALELTVPITPVRHLHAVPIAAATASRRWYSRPAVLLTAAAAAVILMVGAIFGVNAGLQGANSSRQADALAAISSAPDVQRAEASVSTGGSVTLVWSYTEGKSALIGKHLKALPTDKTYELWYITAAGKATDAGLFESNGTNILQVLDGRMVKGDIVGVTVEPAGGSKQPTTKPIVAIASA